MDWNELIKKRHTNFAWSDEVPSDEILKEVCEEVYLHVPSKNLKFPYVVTIMKNDNPDVRKEIMTICHRNKDKTIDEDLGNPQVLAPILFGFSRRDYKSLETLHQKTYTWTEESLDRYGFLEIGIVATYLVLALTVRGINTGFCQNINQNSKRAQELFGSEFPIQLVVGAGYSKGPGIQHYIDPRNDETRRTPYDPVDVDKIYKRPEFDSIFKFKV
jgi:nitroreductase